FLVFFFQAEDGIRDGHVTGVQTCALPILVLNKPPGIVSAMADPERRKTLKNCLRGFPARVYPVGNLEYTASGLVFLTNDGDLAAEMLKRWGELEQVYLVKVKGMLTLEELERLGKEIGVRMKTVRQ